MIKGICSLVFLFISNLICCQDFSFAWQVHPSLGLRSYTIKVVRIEFKREIYIREGYSGHFKIRKIEKDDCNNLLLLLNKVDFSDRSSNTIKGPKFREYINTRWMSDSNWVIFQNDTIRRDLFDLKYSYDCDLKMYYGETQMMKTYTDGTNYYGEYITPTEKKVYSIYCVRLTDTDYRLNMVIYGLVAKYFKIKQYKYLGNIIEEDKPRISKLN